MSEKSMKFKATVIDRATGAESLVAFEGTPDEHGVIFDARRIDAQQIQWFPAFVVPGGDVEYARQNSVRFVRPEHCQWE
jgi:hypothetical protein